MRANVRRYPKSRRGLCLATAWIDNTAGDYVGADSSAIKAIRCCDSIAVKTVLRCVELARALCVSLAIYPGLVVSEGDLISASVPTRGRLSPNKVCRYASCWRRPWLIRNSWPAGRQRNRVCQAKRGGAVSRGYQGSVPRGRPS